MPRIIYNVSVNHFEGETYKSKEHVSQEMATRKEQQEWLTIQNFWNTDHWTRKWILIIIMWPTRARTKFCIETWSTNRFQSTVICEGYGFHILEYALNFVVPWIRPHHQERRYSTSAFARGNGEKADPYKKENKTVSLSQ